MKTRISFLLCVVLCCGPLRAQEKIDPAFERIEPFLKENTFLVVHVDLKALDVDAAVGKIREKLFKGLELYEASQKKEEDTEKKEAAPTDEVPNPPMAMQGGDSKALVGMMFDMIAASIKQARQGMLDAGVEGFYQIQMVESMAVFSDIMAIPGEPQFDDRTNQMLQMAGYQKAGFADEMTFYVQPAGAGGMGGGMMPGMGAMPGMTQPAAPKVSPDHFMNILRRAKTKYRPEINDALYLQRKSPIRVVFAPPKMMKATMRTFQKFLPVQPEMLGVEPTQTDWLIREMETLSVGADLAALRLNTAVQFPDEEKAEEAEKIFAGIAAGVEDEVQRVFVHEFLPKANKKRLILVVKEEHVDKLVEMVPAAAAMMGAQNAMQTVPAGGETTENTEPSDSME